MIPYRPKIVLVQEQAWQDAVTREILERLPGIEVQTIDNKEIGTLDNDTLVLMRYPGRISADLSGCPARRSAATTLL